MLGNTISKKVCHNEMVQVARCRGYKAQGRLLAGRANVRRQKRQSIVSSSYKPGAYITFIRFFAVSAQRIGRCQMFFFTLVCLTVATSRGHVLFCTICDENVVVMYVDYAIETFVERAAIIRISM